MRPPVVLAAALLLTACSANPNAVEAPKLPFDLNLFPSGGGGSKLLADIGAVRLEIDPTTRDPIVALGECVDAAVYCYEPGTKGLSWCLQNTRTCKTDAPWTEEPCCPQQCKDDFEDALSKGTTPAKAIEAVFFDEKTCFPGVREALEAP
jgi:hypothetical protein